MKRFGVLTAIFLVVGCGAAEDSCTPRSVTISTNLLGATEGEEDPNLCPAKPGTTVTATTAGTIPVTNEYVVQEYDLNDPIPGRCEGIDNGLFARLDAMYLTGDRSLEIYCQNEQRRFCLTGLDCPWRRGQTTPDHVQCVQSDDSFIELNDGKSYRCENSTLFDNNAEILPGAIEPDVKPVDEELTLEDVIDRTSSMEVLTGYRPISFTDGVSININEWYADRVQSFQIVADTTAEITIGINGITASNTQVGGHYKLIDGQWYDTDTNEPIEGNLFHCAPGLMAMSLNISHDGTFPLGIRLIIQ